MFEDFWKICWKTFSVFLIIFLLLAFCPSLFFIFFFFPVRALAQGSLLVRSPSCRGWSSRGAADFRSTKIVVRSPSLEKIIENLTKNSARKRGSHRPNFYWTGRFAQKCYSVKNRFSKMPKIEKNSSPRTSSFLDWKPISAIEAGGQKGDQTMESPMSCAPLFF